MAFVELRPATPALQPPPALDPARPSAAYNGYVTVHWDKIERDVHYVFDRDGDGKVGPEDLAYWQSKVRAHAHRRCPLGWAAARSTRSIRPVGRSLTHRPPSRQVQDTLSYQLPASTAGFGAGLAYSLKYS